MAESVLIAENIFLNIGNKEILNGCTIRAEKGNVTGLLGRNGAGKSMILQAVFGARHSRECDVFWNGEKMQNPCQKVGFINYLPQFQFIPSHLSLKMVSRQFNVVISEILAFFPEFEADVNKCIGEMSGGQVRLFSVLLLLFAETHFTLLDEPFTHISPLYVERLKGLIAAKKEQKGIILTDHMYRLVLEVTDVLYLVKDGQTTLIKERSNLALYKYVNEPV